MNGFTRCADGPLAVAPDPRKRVNFMPGLVLGVDELMQESAFLADRAEWLARDLMGYGTVSGLRVSRETVTSGPAIVVGSGIALSPRGRPIRVAMPQAVALNDWLDAHRTDLVHHLAPGLDSPPGDVLRLSVVLGYQQCATDNQPGPGEPCRTDEVPRVFTRIADDFSLDLRFRPPEQREELAARELVAWLRRVEIVDSFGGTATIDEFLGALRTAAFPGSPPDDGFASPPEPLRISTVDAAEFFRAACGLWVTELRPLWRTRAPEDDVVLLAEVEVPVVTAAGGRWEVADASRVLTNDARRPYVLALRLLQELALRDAVAVGTSTVAAAGIIKGDASNSTHRRPLINGLRVTAVTDGQITIAFNGYVMPSAAGSVQYIVKALPASDGGPVTVNLGAFESGGIRMRLTAPDGSAIPAATLASLELIVEVTRYAS